MSFLREILVQTHVLPMSFKIFSDKILVLDAGTAYVQRLSCENLVLVACVVFEL